jgi:Photosynthesis system II assembly factor YCF48/Putative zinc-finger
MNQEIPKPLRNALARQAVGGVHPSPDALTSFVERTLAPVESEAVTHHLAQCAECREIVFLASNAAEDEVPVERDLVVAAAVRQMAPMPGYAASSRPVAARAETPRPRWTIRTRWALSIAAAVVLVSAGLVLQFSRARNAYKAATLTVASNRPAPASPEARQNAIAANSQEAAAQPPVPATVAKAAPHSTMAAQAYKAPAQTTVARNAADQYVSAPAPEPAARATSAQAPAGAAVGGLSTALVVPEVRPQSALAESAAAQKSEDTQSLQLKQGAPMLFGKSKTGMHAVSAVRPQWRIGPNGQLERSMATSQWSRVLDDQPVAFHAVAVIGDDVWAGGNGAALFHSSDGGEHWSKVSLAANSKVETRAIVSIRFEDPQHGVVASDSGTRWTTADGGANWTTP